MSILYEGMPSYRYKKLSPRQNGPYRFYTERGVFKYNADRYKPLSKYQLVVYYK